MRSKQSTMRRLTPAQQKNIVMRAGKCTECGEKDIRILQVHHIKPFSNGGSNDPTNLAVLCPNCHQRAEKGLIKPTPIVRESQQSPPPPLDMALTPPTTKHNAETVPYCQRCGIFPGGAQSECTRLSSSHSFMTRTGVIYCSCCGQRAGVQSVCKRPISTAHSFVAGDGSEYCQRCGVGLGVSITGCVGLQTCHQFVKRELAIVVRPEDNALRTTKYTPEMRRLLQGILGLILPFDENFSVVTLTAVVQPLRDRVVEFFGILATTPMANPMSPFLLHDLGELSEVLGTKETGVSEASSKMFLGSKTRSFITRLRSELEEGLRKHS